MLRDSNISTDVHRLETSSRRQHRTSTLQNGSKLGHTHSMDAFTLKFRSFSIFNDVILYHRPIKALVVWLFFLSRVVWWRGNSSGVSGAQASLHFWWIPSWNWTRSWGHNGCPRPLSLDFNSRTRHLDHSLHYHFGRSLPRVCPFESPICTWPQLSTDAAHKTRGLWWYKKIWS